MGKHTYLDTIENYTKFRANEKRTEFLEKHPEASNQDADALYRNLLELYESNESVRNKLNSEYQDKRAEVQEKYEASMEHARSLGDATENNYKRAETLGPEGLSIASKKGNKTLGPEGRKARTAKGNETLGPEGRKARTVKGKETLGAEGRSEVSRKRIATLKKEGRMGDVIEKTVKTTIELYGEDHYSKQSKEHAVPARIESVNKRVEEDYNLVLSNMPKYFYTEQMRDKLQEILGKPHTCIFDSPLIKYKVKKVRRGVCDIWIHENLGNFCKENSIKSLISIIKKEVPNISGTKLKAEKEINDWMETLPDTGITQDMMNKFKRADRLRKYFDIETEVLGKTGKPIWRKCTWKKKSK